MLAGTGPCTEMSAQALCGQLGDPEQPALHDTQLHVLSSLESLGDRGWQSAKHSTLLLQCSLKRPTTCLCRKRPGWPATCTAVASITQSSEEHFIAHMLLPVQRACRWPRMAAFTCWTNSTRSGKHSLLITAQLAAPGLASRERWLTWVLAAPWDTTLMLRGISSSATVCR